VKSVIFLLKTQLLPLATLIPFTQSRTKQKEDDMRKQELVSSKWHLDWEHETDVSQRNFPEIQVLFDRNKM